MSFDEAAIKATIDSYGEDATEFVRLTIKDADSFMAQVVEAVAQGDAEAAGLAAHALKSIMRQVGAAEVGEAAYAIETAGKAEQIEVCKAQMPMLVGAFGEVRGYLAGMI